MMELAWLAGLIEGEGSFPIDRNKNALRTRISLNMTDLDVVEKARDIIAGIVGYVPKIQVRPNNGYKQQYAFEVARAHAVARLGFALFPFLGKRRKGAIANQLEVWMQRREFSRSPNRSLLDGA